WNCLARSEYKCVPLSQPTHQGSFWISRHSGIARSSACSSRRRCSTATGSGGGDQGTLCSNPRLADTAHRHGADDTILPNCSLHVDRQLCVSVRRDASAEKVA